MAYVNQSKNTSSWTDASKNTATWSDQSKAGDNSYLLKEDSFYLLLETGDKIVLSYGSTDFTDQTKNTSSWTNTSKNTSSYNNQTKN